MPTATRIAWQGGKQGGGRKLYVFGLGMVHRSKEYPVACGLSCDLHLQPGICPPWWEQRNVAVGQWRSIAGATEGVEALSH